MFSCQKLFSFKKRGLSHPSSQVQQIAYLNFRRLHVVGPSGLFVVEQLRIGPVMHFTPYVSEVERRVSHDENLLGAVDFVCFSHVISHDGPKYGEYTAEENRSEYSKSKGHF